IYSNADGTAQYLVLRESQGMLGQNGWSGRTLTSTHAAVIKSFTFPTDLSSNLTATKRVLIATQGFAALNLIVPDYVIPNQFLATDGATVNYAGVDQLTYPILPTDGANAIDHNGAPIPSVATN